MDPPSSSTAIGEALKFVRMSGIFYCPSELTEPWGLELPPMADCVWFHAVTSGAAHLEVDGETLLVTAGDLVLVPHGHGHRAWGAETAATPDVFTLPHEYYSDQYAVLRHGGGGSPTHIVCGGIRFDHPSARHLVGALPSIVHIEAARSTRADWMQATLELMAEETREVRPGSEAVVSRLCDIVVMQAIRTWIERDPAARSGWLGALRDDLIGTAIARVHADPAADWSVASLASSVAMSRSAFAARFTELVGEPVMHYVTRWRMNVAFDLLRSGEPTVAAVASQVGYDSEAAFSRAFKRVMGYTPRAARTGVGAGVLGVGI
ncbi:MAG TPA: AraC family transcriptional regulator [Acidimicrobiales bacterium]|nr:AraC family transcriptional regulator [Acidimicrobiales bacterium]